LKAPSSRLEEEIVNEVLHYALNAVPGPHREHPNEDDLQQARLGILEGLRSYDPEKGRFLSWVVYRVKKSLYTASTRDAIYVPRHTKEVVMRIKKLEQEHGKLPDSKLASLTGIPIERIEEARRVIGLQAVPANQETLPEQFPDLDLREALEALPEQLRAIVEMSVVHEIPLGVIAARMGLEETEVQESLTEALRTLREGLSE